MSINIKMFQRTTNYKPNTKKGFSLFELLVVISIASVVTMVSFSSFPKMNSKLSLDLLAQDIALTLRQAQVYGTTVMGAGATENKVYESYGVSFPNPMSFTGGDYKYTIFADLSPLEDDVTLNMKGLYNEGVIKCMNNSYGTCYIKPCGSPGKNSGGGEDECVQRYSVGGKDKIKVICLNYINSATVGLDKDAKIENCLLNSPQKQPDSGVTVDITYNRPKMQASFRTKVNNEICGVENCSVDPIQNVGIVVEGQSGERRVVIAWANGQIAVER